MPKLSMTHNHKKKTPHEFNGLLPKRKASKTIIGWQEWCALPKLHVPVIKAKIDTGAKTSALHAWDIRPFHKQGELMVHFILHPVQRNTDITIACTTRVIDKRYIMNSGGGKELRYIIKTYVSLGNLSWEIEISLTNRDSMAFRMLLGRDALKGHVLIDPGKTLCLGEFSRKQVKHFYGYKRHTT